MALARLLRLQSTRIELSLLNFLTVLCSTYGLLEVRLPFILPYLNSFLVITFVFQVHLLTPEFLNLSIKYIVNSKIGQFVKFYVFIHFGLANIYIILNIKTIDLNIKMLRREKYKESKHRKFNLLRKNSRLLSLIQRNQN